jgi:hypothetical protein
MPRPSPRPEQSRTVVGQFLCSAFAGEDERTTFLIRHLNAGKRGFNLDEAAFMEAACELVARQFFGSDYDVRDVSSLVSEIQVTPGDPSGQTPDHLKMESVVRAALGEADVDLTGITPYERMLVHQTLIAFITLKYHWSGRQMLELVIEAEQVTGARGWNPPLAEEVLPP